MKSPMQMTNREVTSAFVSDDLSEHTCAQWWGLNIVRLSGGAEFTLIIPIQSMHTLTFMSGRAMDVQIIISPKPVAILHLTHKLCLLC